MCQCHRLNYINSTFIFHFQLILPKLKNNIFREIYPLSSKHILFQKNQEIFHNSFSFFQKTAKFYLQYHSIFLYYLTTDAMRIKLGSSILNSLLTLFFINIVKNLCFYKVLSFFLILTKMLS